MYRACSVPTIEMTPIVKSSYSDSRQMAATKDATSSSARSLTPGRVCPGEQPGATPASRLPEMGATTGVAGGACCAGEPAAGNGCHNRRCGRGLLRRHFAQRNRPGRFAPGGKRPDRNPPRNDSRADSQVIGPNGYSSRARGRRTKANRQQTNAVEIDDTHTPRRLARRRWAGLIKQVWRVDPLVCPRCGAGMKILSFIHPTQADIIEKILTHCGLWEQSSRAPPLDDRAAPPTPDPGELRYVSDLQSVDEPAPSEPLWIAD